MMGKLGSALLGAALGCAALSLLPAPASSQFFAFGQNKIQYR
jgi:hypothetical protein